jgi:hypothetical protein
MSLRRIAAAVLSLVLAAGCTPGTVHVNGPPARAPAQTLPLLRREPLPREEGKGRVSFEMTSGAAKVVEIHRRSADVAQSRAVVGTHYGWQVTDARGEETSIVCVAPCVANLAYGAHELRFEGERSVTAVVDVGPEPLVVRVEPGSSKLAKKGSSAAAMVLGLAGAAALGLATKSALSDDHDPDSGPVDAALIVGGVLLLIAAPFTVQNNEIVDERPSVTTFVPTGGEPYQVSKEPARPSTATAGR